MREGDERRRREKAKGAREDPGHPAARKCPEGGAPSRQHAARRRPLAGPRMDRHCWPEPTLWAVDPLAQSPQCVGGVPYRRQAFSRSPAGT